MEDTDQRPQAAQTGLRTAVKIATAVCGEVMNGGLGFGAKLKLGWGKARRFYLTRFRRGYVKRNQMSRVGVCRRCGACCKLGVLCPFLVNGRALPTCNCHDDRPLNCSAFPIDERDLTDRDVIAPGTKCGYHFNGHHTGT